MTTHIKTTPQIPVLESAAPIHLNAPPREAAARPGPAHVDPDDAGTPPPPPHVKPPMLFLLGLLGIAVLAGLFFYGWRPRVQQERHLQTDAQRMKDAVTRVQAVTSRQAEATTQMLLPGDVQALEETTVYARTTGYLRSWLVDIGDEVQAGQLLAEIDTPEVDQQLRQAQAELGQLKAKLNTAKASQQLAESTFVRYRNLVKTESVTQQGYEERLADSLTTAAAVEAAEADVNAGQANVQRLVELQSFSKVYAPFSGTITSRSIELGQLVTTGASTAQPLYRIAKTDPVRVFIHVPQMYAPGVTVGLDTKIIVRERPDRDFSGKVTRTARAIDPATRTLLTEIQSPNSDHALLTGSYVQVQLKTTKEHPPVLIPATALIVNAEGTNVAVINDELRIHLQPVHVEGDVGADVALWSGLAPGTRIVANPGDRMREGELVQIDQPVEGSSSQAAATTTATPTSGSTRTPPVAAASQNMTKASADAPETPKSVAD